MVNFGPLTAEISWRFWGTPTNFNGFRVLASLLHRRRSMEVKQTLHDVWPCPELEHYYIHFRGSCPVTEFCQVQYSLCFQVLRSPILAALLNGARAVASAKRRHSVEAATYTWQGGHHVCHRSTFWFTFIPITRKIFTT